jgi:hypothetical protein
METMRKPWAIIPATGAVTLLSAIFSLWPNGVAGALLAMSIAAGVYWLGRQKEPGTGLLLLTGVASGLAGAGLAAGLLTALPPVAEEVHRMVPPRPPVWAVLVSGLMYGVFLLLCYWRLVRTAKRPYLGVLASMLGCGLIRAGVVSMYSEAIDMAVGLGIFGGMVFGYLWMRMAMVWTRKTLPVEPGIVTARSQENTEKRDEVEKQMKVGG